MAPSRRLTAGRSPSSGSRARSPLSSLPVRPPGKTLTPAQFPTPLHPDPRRRPRLVILPSPTPDATTPPSASKGGLPGDVIGRWIKVFWPLHKAWHEGRVSSLDALQGKHLVLYEGGEEEALNLSSHKFEWLEEDPPRRLRRLRQLWDTMEKACSAGNMQDGIGEEDSTGDEERSKAELEDDNGGEIVSGRFRRYTASKKRRRWVLKV